MPQRDNSNFYAAYEFDAIEAGSSNVLIIARIYDDNRYIYSVYEDGEVKLYVFLGDIKIPIVNNITKSSMKLFMNLSTMIIRGGYPSEPLLVFSATGSITYIDDTENKQMVQIRNNNES